MTHSYYVVMIDYGRLGLEAVVSPEITRTEVISRVRTREYKDIAFVHFVHDGMVENVTEEIEREAAVLEEAA